MGALGTKKSGTSSVRLPQLTASDGSDPTQEVTPSRQGLNVLVAAAWNRSGMEGRTAEKEMQTHRCRGSIRLDRSRRGHTS